MFYLRTSIGVEVRQGDLVISSLQSNLAAGVFTHFKRISNFSARDREEVRREVEAFFKSNRLSRDTVVLGIPRGDAILRHLDLPAEVGDNLKQVILYQVQSFEPTEEEKFYYDYAVLPNGGTNKRLRVLLAMVRKSTLDSQLALLRDLGIRPVMVSIASAALTNLLLQAGKDWEKRTFVLLDLRPSGVEVMAVRDGSLVFSREAPREADATWKELLLSEIDTALSRVRLGPDDVIDRIVLSGEPAESAQRELREELPDCDLLGHHLRLETPVRNQPHVQEAAAALGLAYSGLVRRPKVQLNLLPPDLRFRQSRWAYTPAIMLGLAIILLAVAIGVHPLVQNRALIRQLDQEIASLQPRVSRVQKLRSEAEALEKKITFVEGLLRRRDMNLEILQEVTAILPPDSFLSFYTNKEGSITLAGSSNAAPDLIPKLENSKLLRNVTQKGTIFKDAQSGKDRFNFDAKLEGVP